MLGLRRKMHEAAREEEERRARDLKQMEDQLASYRARERELLDAVVTMQALAGDVRARAEAQARTILDEARSQAERIVAHARAELAAITADITRLKEVQRTVAATLRQSLITLDAPPADPPAGEATTAGANAVESTEGHAATGALPRPPDPATPPAEAGGPPAIFAQPEAAAEPGTAPSQQDEASEPDRVGEGRASAVAVRLSTAGLLGLLAVAVLVGATGLWHSSDAPAGASGSRTDARPAIEASARQAPLPVSAPEDGRETGSGPPRPAMPAVTDDAGGSAGRNPEIASRRIPASDDPSPSGFREPFLPGGPVSAPADRQSASADSAAATGGSAIFTSPSPPGPAGQNHDISDEEAILRRHWEFFDALRRNDTAAMARLTGDGFTFSGELPSGWRDRRIADTVIEVHGVGGILTARLVGGDEAVRRGARGEGSWLVSEVWLKREGIWQLLNVRVENPAQRP